MRSVPAAINELPLREFDEGVVLIEEGTSRGNLYFLEEGAVEVLKDGVRLAEVGDRGAVFGDMSLLLMTPHMATVRTSKASSFRIAEDPAALLYTNSEVALYVAAILARRLDGLNKFLVDVKSRSEDSDTVVGMVEDALQALMTEHPEHIRRRV
jgi:signal-transduction protein with cAMP-binding, CBS, and nucleotidyltransferase domain